MGLNLVTCYYYSMPELETYNTYIVNIIAKEKLLADHYSRHLLPGLLGIQIIDY